MKVFNFYTITEKCEVRNEKGQLMRPYVHKSRDILYLRYTLRGVKIMAHHLMWIAHNGPIPEGMTIDHKDHNTFNNTLSNLRLMSMQENLKGRRKNKKESVFAILRI